MATTMSEQRYGYRGYHPDGHQMFVGRGLYSAEESEDQARDILSQVISGVYFDLIAWDMARQDDGTLAYGAEHLIKRIGN